VFAYANASLLVDVVVVRVVVSVVCGVVVVGKQLGQTGNFFESL